jgi:mannose-6-phosphate isomerase-like protein (cupin superfamily)
MIVLEGTGRLVTGGARLDETEVSVNPTAPPLAPRNCLFLSKGNVLIVPPNVPHQLVPTGNSAIVLITIHLPSIPGGISVVPGTPELAQNRLEPTGRIGDDPAFGAARLPMPV